MLVYLTSIYSRPSYIAARGRIVKVCMPSQFLEYWCKVAPILDLECPYVSDGISEPCRVFQCLYRSVKVCYIVSLGKVDAPLRVVESISGLSGKVLYFLDA